MDETLAEWSWARGLTIDLLKATSDDDLLKGFGKDLTQRRPEAQRAIADGDFRSNGQSDVLQVQQQFPPILFVFAIAVAYGNQFLLAVGRGAHQEQHTLVLVGFVLQAKLVCQREICRKFVSKADITCSLSKATSPR